MSKAFAAEIFATPDPQKRKELLQRRPNEVDDSFTQHFLQVASENTDAGNMEGALEILRTLYFCGTHCQRPLQRAYALWAVAIVEHTRNKGGEAIKRAGMCIEECAKAPDQCAQVEIDALDLLVTLQFEHEHDPDKAIETLQRAQAKAKTLGDADRTSKLQQRFDDLVRRKNIEADSRPFVELLKDIKDARGRLTELRRQIDELSSALEAARIEIASVDGRRTAATAEITELQNQAAALTTTRDELQSRQRLFATALTAPLWIAAVRADIQAGRISELTLPLLERLRTAMPEHAQPLIAQIRARNGLSSDQPINLDGLAGEERLFAAVANSLTLDPAADPAAFESLLDAWDTYLSTPAGNGP